MSVGDRVRVNDHYPLALCLRGHEGTIVLIDARFSYPYRVRLDGYGETVFLRRELDAL